MCVCCVCDALWSHQDFSRPLLLHLFINFKEIWPSFGPGGIEVPFETFVLVGGRSRSHLKVK